MAPSGLFPIHLNLQTQLITHYPNVKPMNMYIIQDFNPLLS